MSSARFLVGMIIACLLLNALAFFVSTLLIVKATAVILTVGEIAALLYTLYKRMQ